MVGVENLRLLSEYLSKAKIEVVQEGLKVKYMPDDKELEQCFDFGKNFGKILLEKC